MKRAVYQKWYALLSHISNVKQLLFSLISAFLCNTVLLGSIQFIHSTYYSYTQASSTLINSYLACQFTDIWLPSNLSLFSEFLEQKSVGDRVMYAFLWFPFLSRSAASQWDMQFLWWGKSAATSNKTTSDLSDRANSQERAAFLKRDTDVFG